MYIYMTEKFIYIEEKKNKYAANCVFNIHFR